MGTILKTQPFNLLLLTIRTRGCYGSQEVQVVTWQLEKMEVITCTSYIQMLLGQAVLTL